jgi:hypothetical protein
VKTAVHPQSRLGRRIGIQENRAAVDFRIANTLISLQECHLPRKSIKVVARQWVRWVAASMTLEACLLLRAALGD